MVDVPRHLLRSLTALAGEPIEALATCVRPWASVTFSGVRVRLSLATFTPGADRIAAALENHEFAIPGHVVADIVLAGRQDDAGEARLVIEALVLEDG